ncbi:MAG: radical SAM family heme chaperone HemW [Bacteroidota bacterium]
MNFQKRPAGIYLHIPFCEKKCVYCDFYSIEVTTQMERFVETLCREIEMRAEGDEFLKNTFKATSVFFGGGTPSLLKPEHLEKIILKLRQYFQIEENAEWTMECNPGTVSVESLRAYKALGINRLSFGVQSFNEDELKFLHRIHSPEESREAFRMAREAGFKNVNIDLMFALPGQTLDSLKFTLKNALELEPEHISAYSLIFEEGTPLYTQLLKGKVREMGEDDDAEMYEFAMAEFFKNGYEQYEVSNYAKPGYECRHNVAYWSGDEYLSFGPSAHGFLQGERYWNVRSLGRYTDAIDKGKLAVLKTEKLTKVELMFERAFLEMRAKGLDTERFLKDFGIDIEELLKEKLAEWKKAELIVFKNGRITLAPRGYLVCDEISLHIISALEVAAGVEWKQESEAAENDILLKESV